MYTESSWKGRAKASFWTFLRDDQHLRDVITLFITLSGKSQREICRNIHLTPDKLTNYLRQNDKMLNDWQLLRLCDYLGIKVELKLTMDEK